MAKVVPLSVTAISKVAVAPVTAILLAEPLVLRAKLVLPIVMVSSAASAVSPPIVRVRFSMSTPSKSLAVALLPSAILMAALMKVLLYPVPAASPLRSTVGGLLTSR